MGLYIALYFNLELSDNTLTSQSPLIWDCITKAIILLGIVHYCIAIILKALVLL